MLIVVKISLARSAIGIPPYTPLFFVDGGGLKVQASLGNYALLASDDLSEMFGIEMAPATPRKRAAANMLATAPSTTTHSETSSGPTTVIRPAKPKEPVPKRADGTQRLTPAKRRAISERMRKYWAARRDLAQKGRLPNRRNSRL